MNNKDCFVTLENSVKNFRSKDYNYSFRLSDGLFARWGACKKDDPQFSQFGPEIADIEITTICHGGPHSNGTLDPGPTCNYCYKGNAHHGRNMSFEDFKTIINKINPKKTLTQVAFGLGARGIENPDLWKMCEWLRSQNIIPNGTIANISEETADLIASNFGACAISFHRDFCKNPFDLLADQIKMLTDRGMYQVNVHFVLHQKSFDDALKLICMKETDPRLEKLNAIVFLSLKKCGRALSGDFWKLTNDQFISIVDEAMSKNVGIGFDSCSSFKFENAVDHMNISQENKDNFKMMTEPCESGLFSLYIDVHGIAWPCSFSPPLQSVYNEIPCYDVLHGNNFLEAYWNSNPWRKRLLDNKRHCPLYDV